MFGKHKQALIRESLSLQMRLAKKPGPNGQSFSNVLQDSMNMMFVQRGASGRTKVAQSTVIILPAGTC